MLFAEINEFSTQYAVIVAFTVPEIEKNQKRN